MDGKPTADAKSRVESLLVGSLYKDLAQMQATPASVRRNIERIVVPMRRVAGTDWDIADDVKDAIDAVIEAKAPGLGQDLEKLVCRAARVREPFSDKAIDLAHVLVMGPVKTAKRFRAYAHDYAEAELGQSLFGAPPTQEESVEFNLRRAAKQGVLAHKPDLAQLGFTEEGLVQQEAPQTAPRFESAIVRQSPKLVQDTFGTAPSGRPLLDVIRERATPEIRSIADALEKNVTRFTPEEGRDFARALDKLATLRATNTPIDDFLRQGSFFGKELTDSQEAFLLALDGKNAPAFINRYVAMKGRASFPIEKVIEKALAPED